MIKFRYKRKDDDDASPKSTVSSEAKKSAIISGLRKNGISAITKSGNTLPRNSKTPVENGQALPKTRVRSNSNANNLEDFPPVGDVGGRKNNTLPRTKSDKPPVQEKSSPASLETSKSYEELFSELQFSRERALPADEVRRALAAPFCGQRRFRLGCMADAAECFENILLRVHAHAAHAEPEDACRAQHCVPHRKFAMSLVERSICNACGATSEPLPFTQMVHYVSASALTTQARQNGMNGQNTDNFGDLLKRAGGMGDIRDCPSSCGAKTQICRSLMNKPEIVSIGVVWDSERPTLEHIMDVFGTVGTTLQLKDVFQSVVDNQWASQTNHSLVGVVTYYGKHYSTFFFHTKLKVWIYFDDATVKEVGPRWEQVVEKCRRGRYQPLLLLYATPNGTPCNTENAPTAIVPFPNMNGSAIPQNLLRRSVTPSPEKPNIGNTRRAITPNPDNHIFGQNRQPFNKPYNEYQNLAIIQDNLFGKQHAGEVDVVDGDKGKDADYVSRRLMMENVSMANNYAKRQQIQLHRSLSTGSNANGGDGIVIPDHLNVPRRRDSGNWSGDRNSTSSSSSTTMENPYLYFVGKMQQRNGSLPGSPTRKGELSSGSSGRYDAGYDSYSLSSTDSLPLQQGLKHNLQLAQIPEYQPQIRGYMKPQITPDDCERLCFEADQLLDKSRQTEDAHDLETALVLCNAAATKARAAMDAPYNNPHTMTFARMKHNTCIMRARSLHRRMLQEQGFNEKENNMMPDIRHTREGSNSSARHSRQNSRDKTSHSRQNSKEMLATPATPPAPEKTNTTPNKSIEIYATLPKKKTTPKKSPQPSNSIEDEEYIIYDRPCRESRSIFNRAKNKEEEKVKEKRSRSEDRSKANKDLSVAPDNKDSQKKDKSKEDKEDKKGEKGDKPGKKQHKIRRKLLMGGLIRRKNRSMPDLTEGNDDNNKPIEIKPLSSVDDSSVGLKGMDKNLSGMSGYLSEGHLEYSGNSTNPNLERSKLMRKSFHGSAGKMLTAAKVPPPPPLRTTSQLSGNKQGLENGNDLSDRPPYPLPAELQNNNYYHNFNNPENAQGMQSQYQNFDTEPQSLPFLPSYNENNNNYSHIMNKQFNNPNGILYDSCETNNYNTIVTKADVHQESSPIKPETLDEGVDEVDCAVVRMSNLELPPYPSPPTSVLHSRQASEDFPPPPPPIDTECSEDKGSDKKEDREEPSPTGLLAQLQQKRQQILSQDSTAKKIVPEETPRLTGESWLKELQAKQAALKLKKMGLESNKTQFDEKAKNPVNKNTFEIESGVKNLASRFEFVKASPHINESENSERTIEKTFYQMPEINSKRSPISSLYRSQDINEFTISNRRLSESSICKAQIEEEIREVEMLNAAVNRQLNQDTLSSIESKVDNILRTKKKSVSFCDQVTLVATAEDQEDDSYIPNPILERVLKTAISKGDPLVQQVTLHRQDSMESQKSTVSTISQHSVQQFDRNTNPEYIRPMNSYAGSVSSMMSTESDAPQPRLTNGVANQQVPNLIYQTPPSQMASEYMASVIKSNQILNSHSLTQKHAPYNQMSNGYQQKQNSMYFPVNRTQPPQNNNSNNSPYQHVPMPMQNHMNNENLDANHNSKYNSNGVMNHVSALPYNNYGNEQPSQQMSYNSPYQRVPFPHGNEQYSYARQDGNQMMANYPYQKIPQMNSEHIRPYHTNMHDNRQAYYPYVSESSIPNGSPYQSVPNKISPYQMPPMPKMMPQKKSVSFEPGTKGGDSTLPKNGSLTNGMNGTVPCNNVNNSFNNVNNPMLMNKMPCNLCRKKQVNPPAMYCVDCDFYMSRFKQRA